MTDQNFHEHELSLQNKMGMREQIDMLTERLMHDEMPDQHRAFFAGLEYLFLGTVGENGKPYASVLTGSAGFVSSADAKTLTIMKRADDRNPAFASLAVGSPVSVLGIDLSNRRRNRMHGRIARIDQKGFDITVSQSYGNCPKYISTRAIADRIQSPEGAEATERDELSTEDIDLITKSDTFFIASHHLDGSGQPYEGSDISHRGGNPGFIHVEGLGRFIVPDYKGNNLFNTIGNLVSNSAAALLFVDFETGDLLHINAAAAIIEDDVAIAAYPGAKRLISFNVLHVRRTEAGIGLRWQLLKPSPVNPEL